MQITAISSSHVHFGANKNCKAVVNNLTTSSCNIQCVRERLFNMDGFFFLSFHHLVHMRCTEVAMSRSVLQIVE